MGGRHLSEDEVLVNKIQRETAKVLYKTHGLTLSSEGASMVDEIKEISLGFFSQKQCSVKEARTLVLLASELLLENINKNEKIRKYLIKNPFTVNEIDVAIFFFKNSDSLHSPFLYSAWNNNGRIEYEVKDANTEEIKIIHEETYEEALRIEAERKGEKQS